MRQETWVFHNWERDSFKCQARNFKAKFWGTVYCREWEWNTAGSQHLCQNLAFVSESDHNMAEDKTAPKEASKAPPGALGGRCTCQSKGVIFFF